MPENLANEYVTTLNGAITNSATSFTLTDAPPAALSGGNFRLRIGPAGGTSREYVLVGTVSGSTVSGCTRGVEGTTAAAWSSGEAVAQIVTVAGIDDRIASAVNALAPTNSYETAWRQTLGATNATIPASGTLYLTACYIPKGFSVAQISFVCGGTAAGVPTHWWYGLYNSSRVQLAVTANQTSAAYSTFSVHTLAIATTAAGASSTFLTTYSGLYYIGWMMAATTVASNLGGNSQSSIVGIAPISAGTSSTGQTTPPAFPFTAAVITGDGGTIPYAYVTS